MKTYSIDEILQLFVKYRRWVTGDSIDPIGSTDFEKEFMEFIIYMVNATTKDSK